MVLIICPFGNEEVEAVVEFLKKSEYFILYTNAIHSRYEINIYAEDKRFTIYDETTKIKVDSAQLNSLWLARFEQVYEEGFAAEDTLMTFTSREYFSIINGMIAICELNINKVVNDPDTTNYAGDKIRQMAVAAELGFEIPKQIVTNRKEFFLRSSWQHNAIYKPIHSSNLHYDSENLTEYMAYPLIITEEILDDIKTGELDIRVSWFQQKLEKEIEYRVVVFGSRVYAFKIIGEHGFDWRGYMPNIDFVLETDFELSDKCLNFCDRLNITLGAFDFIKTTEGIYFIECNPPGYFIFCDPESKTGMVKAFAEYLLN